MKKLDTRSLIFLALLVALSYVLSFFSIGTPLLRVGFGFIPTNLMGFLFGPLWGGIGAAIADIIGATLNPQGAYFPGFTLNAMISGALYGYFYFGKKITFKRTFLAILVVSVLINLILTPMWLTIMYKTPFWAQMPPRIVKNLITIPLHSLIMTFLMARLPFNRFLKLKSKPA
ncbi:folate family ECF transporter S component [Enterococcus hirae]|nr:folate family ECF transporter S component [Enterococcus hirae]